MDNRKQRKFYLENLILKAGALQWLGDNFIDVDLNVLSLIMFIAVVSAMVQLVEMVIEKVSPVSVSYTHLRAHETLRYLVWRGVR